MVTWWSTGYDIGSVDLKRSWWIELPFCDFPKREKFCMSGPVKFDEKLQKRKTFQKPWNIPSESSKQHLDKFLTFIVLIGTRYLTYSIIVQILQVLTCQVWRKIKICQICWKPLLSKVVTWWSTSYDIGRVDLKCSWSIDLPIRDFPKSEISTNIYAETIV